MLREYESGKAPLIKGRRTIAEDSSSSKLQTKVLVGLKCPTDLNRLNQDQLISSLIGLSLQPQSILYSLCNLLLLLLRLILEQTVSLERIPMAITPHLSLILAIQIIRNLQQGQCQPAQMMDLALLGQVLS